MKEISEVWWEPGIVIYKRVPNNDNGYGKKFTVDGNLEVAIHLAIENNAVLHINHAFVCDFQNPDLNKIRKRRAEAISCQIEV